MSSPTASGPTANSHTDVVKRTVSARGCQTLVRGRKASAASSVPRRRDTGSSQRMATVHSGGGQARMVRKKLPWLDGPQQSKIGQVPGTLDPVSSSAGSGARDFGEPAPMPSAKPAEKRASIKSLTEGPSLRAVGSSPSLRDRAKDAPRTCTLSLNSEARPGVKPAFSKQHAKRVLGVASEKSTKAEDYTPSEYSTTISSDAEHAPPSDIEPRAARLQKKDPASYERLVQTAPDRRGTRPTAPAVNPQWLQSQLNLPLVELAPTAIKRRCKRSGSCQSCDSPVMSRRPTVAVPNLPPLVQQPTVISTATARRGTTVPKPLPSIKQAALRKAEQGPILRELPPHLMAPSSSPSADIPEHLRMTSTEPSSNSPGNVSSQAPTPAPSAVAEVSPKASIKPPAPVARRHRALRHENRSFSHAASHLEQLMEQALHVANDAAQSGRPDDVAHVLDSATAALWKASTAISYRHSVGYGTTTSPLQLSPHESGISSYSSDSDRDVHSGTSSMHSREASADTAPTLLTKSAHSSAQPILATRYTRNNGTAPASLRASIEHNGSVASSDGSILPTLPRLYQPPSNDSVVRDFAYAGLRNANAQSARALSAPNTAYGEAADFYGDHGDYVALQPGVCRSVAFGKIPALDKPLPTEKPLPALPPSAAKPAKDTFSRTKRGASEVPGDLPKTRRLIEGGLRQLEHAPMQSEQGPQNNDLESARGVTIPQHRKRGRYHPPLSDFFETSYYRNPEHSHAPHEKARQISSVTDARSVSPSAPANPFAPPVPPPRRSTVAEGDASLEDPAKQASRRHISLRDGQGFSLGRYHRRQPIAREWNSVRKRITAAIACANTVFIGLIAGIYAGEVPRIQYQVQDTGHRVILGNVLLFIGLGLSTIIFWPLPLLHGRKPYTLLAFALMLPLQFPQALAVTSFRNPNNPLFRCGLLIPRVLTGLAMGFANMNQLPTLFDLFGCSLMSKAPHQELVTADDVRRQGGGMGIWLGIWSFCFVGSLSIGFCIGACIISGLDPSWGFYIVVILLAVFMLVNVVAPETRRAPYRRSIAHFIEESEPDQLKRRVARGEVKLHISNEGPKWWFQEVWAGLILTKRMMLQPGFFVLVLYLAWIYTQVVLVILLLGALLSRNYVWQPQYVGLASLSLAIGALLALPLAKASVFSRARTVPQRTDSMTMRPPRLTWSSHLARRCTFTLLLPFAGLAYTLSSPGPSVSWASPTVFCGLVGFLSNLAIAECVGLIMEVFDTCDLQPGVNSKHRLQSMTETTRRRRTNYSSFPRVCAGFFAAQTLGFFLAAAATGTSGAVTRALGAQISVGITAAILLGITVLFMAVMFRFKEVQVIPSGVFDRATKKGSIAWVTSAEDPNWKAVVIGNPSGKMRRVNLLEMGSLTRWTEIRRLNRLVRK